MRPSRVALTASLAVIAACSVAPASTPATTPAVTATAPTATAAPSPVLTPAATQTHEPAPTAAPTISTTTWTEVYGLDDTRISSLIEGPTGLIAAGCRLDDDGDCIRPLVLLSGDAVDWEEFALDGPIDLFVPTLRRIGDRLFALAYGHWGQDGGAVVLTSTDGRAWRRVESSSFRARSISDVIDTSFGMLAVGYEAPIDSDNTSGFVVWPVHADGSFGADRIVEVTDDALYGAAVWTGDELLAWGFRRWQGGPAALLASRDGKSWKSRAPIAAFDDGLVADMVAAPDGLVAVGYEGRLYPLVPRAWTSPDAGRSWLPAAVPSTDGAMFDVSLEGSRLVAQGQEPTGEEGRFASWSSADGRVWSRIDDDAFTPAVPDFLASQRATIRDRLCVVGTVFGEGESRGAIYCRLTAP